MFINFRDIPNQYNLFLDYLYDFEKVKSFYPHNFRDRESYLKIFRQVSESTRSSKKEISSIIAKQYKDFDPSQKTLKNISSIAAEKTLAVVTGQQLGILGGPLYTIYKIITTIKLSNQLSERYDDYNFVPVFWLEGDDHDFNEIRTVNVIDEKNELVKIEYGEEIPEEESRRSVGTLKLDSSINEFFSKLQSALRETEFKEVNIEKLKSFYSEGKSIKQAFKELLFWLFDEHGLVLFDPQDKKVKNLLKPIFKKEVNDYRQHSEKLVSVSAQLEELYHAQVKLRPVNLFYSLDDGRFAIEPGENDFRLKRKRKYFTREELLNLIDESPEAFSPNVMLRLICQDYLLPTALYVAGPGEIAYFAQLMPLYELYGIDPPVIYPRASATLLEKNSLTAMAKQNLTISDFFTAPEDLKIKIVNNLSEIKLEDVFGEAVNQIELTLDQLKEKLFGFDKTIADASNKYKQKIFHQINELKGKALQAQKKKHEITLRQIDKVATAVYPNSNLQERELNFFYFANKYGVDFLKQIFDQLEISKFEHQIINL